MKMKKFMRIMALLAALALIVTGCPGGGDPGEGSSEGEAPPLNEIFSTTEPDQSDSGTRLTLGEDTFSFVGTSSANGDIQAKLTVGEEPFDAAPYLGFKFEYKSNANLQIMLVIDTSGGDDKGVWITEHDWNGIASAPDWSPLEVRFSRLAKAWGNGSAFDPATLCEILFQVPEGYDDYSFELRKFEWIPNPNYVPGEPPTPPEEDPDPNPAGTVADGTEQWYLALGENGLKAQNNKKILYQDGDNYVHIYFKPPAGTYTGIKIDFTLEPGQNVSWQAAYDAAGTWGGVEYIDNLEAGPIETDLAGFNQSWGASGPALDKATLKGLCLAVSVKDAPSAFTLTGVTFAGAEEIEPPPDDGEEEEGEKAVIFDSNGFVTGASIKTPSTVTVNANNITVAWDTADNEGKGAYRVEIQLAADARKDLSSDYSKFGMEWASGSANGGNFNISLFFPGNRMLSKYVGNGSATFNFTSDHPSWASGWGDAAVGTITGFEIFSDDVTNFGRDDLVITKIWFE